MTSDSGAVSAVVSALKGRGFVFVGRDDEGWLKLNGPLVAQGSSHQCELSLDPGLFELPRVRLLKLPASVKRVTPHLGAAGHLCYVAKGSIVLDLFDPIGQTLACVVRAEEILDAVLQGKMVADLEEEFFAYWGGQICLVDLQDTRLGRQECLVIKPGDDLTAVLTDDKVRTTKKLKALNWEPTDQTLPAYRVKTHAKPRPDQNAWPPKTVGQLLSWQGQLDLRCRKKIEKRIQQALETRFNGAFVLVESPLMTYGFAVLFERKQVRRGATRTPRAAMYAHKVVPMTVVRIDDRYMAQRNVPGTKTLAGLHIALVGCGTIGGYLAEMLVKAGAGTSGGQLTLVDFDSLFPQNVGRHRLGFAHLFQNKAKALRDELERLAPAIDARAMPVDVRDVQLGKLDLIIDATGEEALGHWLCQQFVQTVPMLSSWIEGPGLAVRALLRSKPNGACFRCFCDANRAGELLAFATATPTVLAGHGCEGLYVPFPSSVSVQAASLASEMAVAWANNVESPALRTKVIDQHRELAIADCDPPAREGCPACAS